MKSIKNWDWAFISYFIFSLFGLICATIGLVEENIEEAVIGLLFSNLSRLMYQNNELIQELKTK